MDEDIRQELNKILNELPGENSWLDYKAKAYEDHEMAGLVNDICAFLNSEQSYGRNKYIICGISNDKTRIGIDPKDMKDDKFFQDAIKHIYPIPKIETDIYKHIYKGKEYCYGYVLISKDNYDRVYEIYKPKYKQNDNNLYTIKEILEFNAFAPIAWIRVGSTKDPLTESTRRRIYETDNYNKKNEFKVDFQYSKNDNSKILKAALLFGSWNEKNENDKRIIERYTGISYDNFINQFRIISKKEKDFIFKNGIWKIENRAKYFKYYSLDFYKDDFDNFYNITIDVLKEKHPKLELSIDKRYMYNIYGKITKYSTEIREGISENLVLVEYLNNEFGNCTIDASNYVILSIREILKDSDWQIWASLDKCLPLLAEATPSEFLNQLEDYLKKDVEIKIITEYEDGITSYNYSTSIYWSLELIAWNTDTCVRTCMILAELAKKDKKAIDHIANILLPWYPNTFAPFIFRKTIVENILKLDVNIGWTLIKKLMPGETTYSIPTYKPKYINIPKEQQSLTNKEYYDQIDEYVNLMIKYCKFSDDRLIDLINLLNDVSRDNFDKICNYLKSSRIVNKNDKSKYKLWNKLKRMSNWINKQKDIKEEIKREMLDKIDCVTAILKPDDDIYIISRLFIKNTWDLIEDYDNYSEAEKKLNDIQINEIERFCEKQGINRIIDLANIVEDSYKLGYVFANINLSIEEEKNLILHQLDKTDKLIDFSKGYIYKKYNADKFEYDIESLQELSIKSKSNFLQMLPYTIQTFKNVKKILNEKYKEYWKYVDIRTIDNNEALDYAVKELMEVKRFSRVLWMYRITMNNKNIKCDNNIILTCLENIKDNYNQYDICEAIEDLQKNKADKNRLFYIEWKYLPFLNHGEYRPITMEIEIASDVNKYAEILELAFKEHSKEKDDRNIDSNISMNAYRLLHQWKFVPGTEENGFIDGKKLNSWFDEMQKVCKEKDRLEVGLSCFGKVLFYSPKDKKGFWIDKSVANILNKNDIIMDGYKNEAFNSVGVVNWDENGTDYLKKRDEYQQKAEQTELEGYYNFATALREIAQNFEFHANHMKDSFYDR